MAGRLVTSLSLGTTHSTVFALPGALSNYYTTLQQSNSTPALPPPMYPTGGVFSLDSRVRQVAAGYSDPGKYVGADNGGAHASDLHPNMQILLFAHQILSSERVP